MTVVEGETQRGVITDIKPYYQLGGEGDDPIAIIMEEGQDLPSWLPLPDGHDFAAGDCVLVTPQTTTYENGAGPKTVYLVTKNS